MAINSAFLYSSYLNNNLVSQDWTSVMNQLVSSGGLNMSALTSTTPTYGMQAYQAAAALSSLSQLQSGWGSMLGGSLGSLGSYGATTTDPYAALSSFGSSLGSLGSSMSSFGAPYSTLGYGSSAYGSNNPYGSSAYGSFNPYTQGSYGTQAPPPPPPPHHHHHQQNGGQNWSNGGQNWGAGGAVVRNGNWPSSGWGDQNCQNDANIDTNTNPYGSGSQAPQTGTLTQDGGDGSPITYQTSGGWTIAIDGTTTTFTDPDGKQTVQYSGDPHEYVNGEHVKDWNSEQRTLELPDGTKVTLSATAANGTTTSTSIYDGNTAYNIDNTSNTVTSTTTGYDALQREQAQYDGETAQLTYNQSGGLNYTNLYTQNADFSTTSSYADIASTTLANDGSVSVKDNYAAS